jgi:hypothetical protein
MSDRTKEISTAVKATDAGMATAGSQAEQSLNSAQTKYETATMHGWNGVAGNMELATQALEGVVEQLSGSQQASQNAYGALDEISDTMSSPEIVEHLVTTSHELEVAHDTAESAVNLVDEAMGHCQAAGQESIQVSLNSLRDDVMEVLEQLQQARADVEVEQGEAEQFAESSEGTDDPGN